MHVQAIPEVFVWTSVRYALGRKTYVVSDVVEAVIAVWAQLTRETRRTIRDDVEAAYSRYDRDVRDGVTSQALGMDMDKREWDKVRALWANDES